MTELEELLARAREADPLDRMELRDGIAALGGAATEPMADWVGDPRLAAFAIRVLACIGRDPAERAAVVDVLRRVDRAELPAHLARDLDEALAGLRAGGAASAGSRPRVDRSAGEGSVPARASGLPGVPGRGYWVMRTSPWERPFVWSEVRAGRLRQGWSSEDDQNLEVIARVLRAGGRLSESQQYARRNLRMLTSWDGGMRLGDIVVLPNLPEYGRLSVVRVAGSYEWAPVGPFGLGERFGHLLPVELLAGDIDRDSPAISAGLRAVLGVQTRLYNISGYGGDVERLVGGTPSPDRWGELWTVAEYVRLFGAFPPDGPRPTDAEAELLAMELGRTLDAITWQWGDGAAYVGGRSALTASEPLKAWLDRRGLGG